MEVIKIDGMTPPSRLMLGRQGENLARRIVIDISGLIEQHGDGSGVVIHKRAGDDAGHPVAVVRDGESLVWDITSAETFKNGMGKAEIQWFVGDVLAKSATITTEIRRAVEVGDEMPEPLEGYIQQLEAAKANANQAAQELREAAERGDFDGRDGRDGVDGRDGRDGVDGKDGAPGEKGEKGETTYVENPYDDAEIKNDVSELREEIAKKATNPQSPVVGQWGRVKEIGADGQPVWETAELPIAGGGTNVGVVSFSSSYGTNFKESRYIGIEKAGHNDVDSRNDYRPIVPCNLDYAVKAAMCDGKGPAWTPEEQSAGRQRLGLDGNYELIEEITLQDETMVIRSVDTMGNAYNFSSLMYTLTVPSGIALSANSMNFSVLQNGSYCTYQPIVAKTDAAKTAYMMAVFTIQHGRLFAFSSGGSIVDVGATVSYSARYRSFGYSMNSIRNFRAVLNTPIPGAILRIEGVRI